ncbi:MAG: OmpH family outer membrane protein [Gemmatimonadota bacterium]
MRFNVRATLVAFGLLALASGSVTAQGVGGKLAYIDSRVVLDKAPGRAAAESTFQKEYDAAQVKIKKMQDTLEAMGAAYQKSSASLTAVTRELREKEIRDKQQSFENAARLLEAQMQQRQGELVQPMMNQIREVLDSLRKEDGYAFIFDIGTNTSVIVAADSTLNITEKVVSRLKPLPVAAESKPSAVKAQPAGVIPKKPTL